MVGDIGGSPLRGLPQRLRNLRMLERQQEAYRLCGGILGVRQSLLARAVRVLSGRTCFCARRASGAASTPACRKSLVAGHWVARHASCKFSGICSQSDRRPRRSSRRESEPYMLRRLLDCVSEREGNGKGPAELGRGTGPHLCGQGRKRMAVSVADPAQHCSAQSCSTRRE